MSKTALTLFGSMGILIILSVVYLAVFAPADGITDVIAGALAMSLKDIVNGLKASLDGPEP